MELWVEAAYQSLVGTNVQACGDIVSTFQTEEQFTAIVISGAYNAEGGAAVIAQKAASALEQGKPLNAVAQDMLTQLPQNEHAPFAILHAHPSPLTINPSQLTVRLVECDAPPLFFVRKGRLVLLPVVEEELRGRLIRECEFTLQDGDHLAMVSEGYIQAKGWSRQWGWRDIALSIKRLTDTRCDAGQLLGALIRSYQRLATGEPSRDVSVVAMFIRPLRTITVWSGPPVKRDSEQIMLNKLMAETGVRIICGDTSAEIAARLMGAKIEMEARPQNGWAEVPPVSQLAGVDLVTEGVVTIGKARERMASAKSARDLPRKEDGATRLARSLLHADKINVLVGLAINPAQTADKAGKIPIRQIVIEGLISDLQARGKVVTVEYF